ncbi:MAG: hypothetical protein LC754_14245 [Acidobacteria bacterium]|nr:hypothetical protein [Acidobacteriota bacterium]
MTIDPALNNQLTQPCPVELTAEDLALLEGVDKALADSVALKRWWEQTDAANSYDDRFDLIRQYNPRETCFGFFDEVPLADRTLRVMGTVGGVEYDQPKSAFDENLWAEFREFILHYFMRVSSYRRPAAFVEPGQTRHGDVGSMLQPLSWCPESEQTEVGFGYSQLYYKLRDSGVVGKFAQREEYAVVDLREIGEKYEWIVVKVSVFNFNLTFSPFGSNSMTIHFPHEEEIYLVMSRDFITHEENPTPGLAGRYGYGYAFLKRGVENTLFAGSSGIFKTGFQLINFSLDENGQSRARLTLVVNRPEQVLDVEIDPVGWSFKLADLMSFGLASRLLSPVKGVMEQLSPRLGSFDPVTAYISLASAVSAGLSTERLCISMETLEKEMLIRHFVQHYEMITGTLTTWRHTRTWLDPSTLPKRVIWGWHA